jgi:aminomethyltransferase
MKSTPLNAWHRAHGASMVDFGGWDMPVAYGPIGPEHLATRRGAGLFDIGHMGQVLVEGDGAEAYLQGITTNDVAALGDGRMQYSLLPNDRGGLHDDIIVTRRCEGKYYVVVNASNTDADFAWMKSKAPHGVTVRLWEGQTLLALQGPKAQALLQPLVDSDLDSLKYYHLRSEELQEHLVLVSRSGYTGEDGFEISLPTAAASALWDTLVTAGAVPVGLGARNTLRLEAAYPLYGHEIDSTTTPYEAGLGWVVKPSKGEFIGRGPMLLAKEAPARRLAGFKLVDRGVARDGYPVLDGEGRPIGRVTSGGPSPSLDNECIGLAYLPPDLARPGASIHIDVRGRALKAEVVKTPFVSSNVRKNTSA